MQPLPVRTHLSHRALNKEFVTIPGTGLRVSRVALGTCALPIDKREAAATVHAALDQGINFIDTAPVYGFGVAEQLVGRALSEAGVRAHIIIATKAGLEWRDRKIHRNGTRERIMAEVDDSLRRLRTDYIDVYQVHRPDPLVPVEETAEAMHAVYKQGKIRAIGVCNFSVDEMRRFARVAPLHVLQSPYNLFERAIEHDVLPYCFSRGVVTLGAGSLCHGLLSGRMRPGIAFEEGDLRCHDPKFLRPRFEQYLHAVQQLDHIAREHHRRVIHLAARWILDQGVSVALWGGRHPEQIEPALGVGGWSLDLATRARIDRILQNSITEPVVPELTTPQQRVRPSTSSGQATLLAQHRGAA